MARTHIAFARHSLFTQRFSVQRGNGLWLRRVVKRGLRGFADAEIGRGFLFGQSLPCGARVLLRLLGKLLRVLGDGLRFLLNLYAEIVQFLLQIGNGAGEILLHFA